MLDLLWQEEVSLDFRMQQLLTSSPCRCDVSTLWYLFYCVLLVLCCFWRLLFVQCLPLHTAVFLSVI